MIKNNLESLYDSRLFFLPKYNKRDIIDKVIKTREEV